MRITTFLIAIAAFCIVASCGKATPESETKRWASSQKTLETLGAKYPGFKPALQEVLKSATQQWEAAVNVSGEEAQIEAMRAANNAASPGFVSKLEGLSGSLEKLKDMATEAMQSGATDEGDKAALNTAKQESDLTLNEVEKMLKNGSANTPNEAEALVNDAASKVEAATSRFMKVMETIKGKKAQANAADTAAANNATAAEKAKDPIKCGSCGTMNPHDALKCSACTAPIEKK